MQFLAIIPARYASSRFPGKPLADINGQSMIERVYKRVNQLFEHCFVATDDQRIEETVLRFGGRVVMTSEKHRSGTDRCGEALEKIEAQTGLKFDVAVNVQGDEPFVSEEHLTKIKEAFLLPDTQIATLVKPFSPSEDIFNPNSPKAVVSLTGFALYFSRSAIPFLRNQEQSQWQQQFKYYKHLGMYAYRTDILRKIVLLPQGILEQAESLEQLRWLENGYTIRVSETTTETIAIDTPEDLQRVLDLLK